MDATFHLKNAVFNYRVAGVMIKNGHVLIHRQANETHWALPGGRVKVLEDSQTSIKREMKEELGFDVTVDNLLWITENFFAYNNQNYHEIGLYYSISSADISSTFSKEAFHGEEGERLIYQWTPISEINNIILYPEFLKNGLKEIPSTPKHLIINDYKM